MIIPVLLEKSFDTLVTKIKSVDSHAPMIQIDIMDGTITEQSTFNKYEMLDTIQTPASLEIHLMVKNPMNYLKQKVNKCKSICTQIEHGIDVESFIDKAKSMGYRVGISMAVDTEIEKSLPYVKKIDFIQFMTVKIGKQGQKLDESVLKKIKKFHKKYKKIPIQVDGGVMENNIRIIRKAGVDNFIVGSAIFGGGNALKNYIQLKSLPWIK